MAKCEITSDGTLIFWCSGCDEPHGIPIFGPQKWTWNGSLNLPTITPSIKLLPHKSSPPFKNQVCCHSIITDGKIYFCPDSGHKLAGQTVEIPEWE